MTLQLRRRGKMLRSLLAATAIWCLSTTTGATELQPFTAESMAAIEERYAGRPFVLGLWSLTCPPCLHELKTLSEWHKRNPAIPVVLIATDEQDQAETVSQTLEEAGLAAADNWLYGDSYVEKLRFKIDPAWRGELPRSYLYSPPDSRHAISGALTTKTLNQWKMHIQATDASASKQSEQ